MGQQHRRGGWMGVLCAAVLCALLLPATARPEIRIETAYATAEATELVQLLRTELGAASGALATLNGRVTIGPEAFRAALANDDGQPLIAAYLTSTEFEEILGDRPRPPNVTAVFSNPDPRDQVALAEAILGRGRATLGAFDSAAAHPLVTRMQAQDRGVRAIPAPSGQSIDTLLRAADSVDAIIVLPDPAILNRSNINHVVRTLYQRRKVLIGYSDTLVRVGSLASVYPTRTGIARRVADVLQQYATRAQLPPPIFVRGDVDVSLNERLARSLTIALPDRDELLRIVRATAPEPEAAP